MFLTMATSQENLCSFPVSLYLLSTYFAFGATQLLGEDPAGSPGLGDEIPRVRLSAPALGNPRISFVFFFFNGGSQPHGLAGARQATRNPFS